MCKCDKCGADVCEYCGKRDCVQGRDECLQAKVGRLEKKVKELEARPQYPQLFPVLQPYHVPHSQWAETYISWQTQAHQSSSHDLNGILSQQGTLSIGAVKAGAL